MTCRTHLVSAAFVACACRVDPLPGAPFEAPDDAEQPGPVAPPDEPAGGRGGTTGGGTTGGGSSIPSAGTGPETGAPNDPPPGACDAQPVTLEEIREGVVLSSVTVSLVATATSQKFLVSQTEAGSCLWGAFVGDVATGGEPRGVLVVSYGGEAASGAPCEPGTDAILDDLSPGDRIRAIGRASSFAPSSCDGVVAAPQLIADARCRFERIERAEPIEPVTLPLDVASELARGGDESLVRRLAGGLVRLENVSALPNETRDGAVRPYGVVALAETDLEVHADIEYGDLSEGGPRDASKALALPYPAVFRSITGLVYLDYCTYALAPRRRCQDFDPKSADCP